MPLAQNRPSTPVATSLPPRLSQVPLTLKYSHQAAKVSELAQRVDTQAHLGLHNEFDRDSLIRSLREMLDDVSGPVDTMIQLTSTNHATLAVIRALIYFDVAGLVPNTGTISIASISSKAGADRGGMERLLRFAMSQGIFHEAPKGSKQISHSNLSKAMLQLEPWITSQLDFLTVLVDFKLPKVLELSDLRKEKTAAELAFGQTYWEALEQHPDSIGTDGYHRGLECISKIQTIEDEDPVVTMYDWGSLPEDTLLVDVGGGKAQLMIQIAKNFPSLHCVSQDLEMNRISAELEIPQELASRVTFQTHDFFTPQPLHHNGPVVYIMRRVLQKWPDSKCEDILKHLLPGLRCSESRLLVIESVLSDASVDEHGEYWNIPLTFYAEAQMRRNDLDMLKFFGSKERTFNDFVNLFDRVDKGLQIQRVLGTRNSKEKLLDVTMTVIEVL